MLILADAVLGLVCGGGVGEEAFVHLSPLILKQMSIHLENEEIKISESN